MLSADEWLVMAVGAGYILAYGLVAVLRLRYPFELEWMEGAVVDHVTRVLAGEKLYVPPSIDFVPFVYPPLYFYIGALASKLLGVGFFALRMVSFTASLGSLWLIFAIARRESGSPGAGFLAAALFAACFRLGGGWYDIARIDSLFLVLVLLAAYLVRFGSSGYAWSAAGLLLAMAFFTKQTAVLIALPVFAYGLLSSRRLGLALTTTFVVVAGLGTWIFDRVHGGWYFHYVFVLPARIQRIDAVDVDFWSQDIVNGLPVAAALSVGYIVAEALRLRTSRQLFYPLLAAGLVGSAWLSRLHAGAFDNVLIPAYAGVSILFGLAAIELKTVLRSRGPRHLGVYVSAVVLVQFALLHYDPRREIPGAGQEQAGHELVATMAAIPGDILMPQHRYLPVMAGKRAYAHSMAVYDILRAGRAAERARLLTDFHRALTQQQFGAVIVDRVDGWMRDDLEQAYQRSSQAVSDGDRFWPVTGLRTRPEWIYVPR